MLRTRVPNRYLCPSAVAVQLVVAVVFLGMLGSAWGQTDNGESLVLIGASSDQNVGEVLSVDPFWTADDISVTRCCVRVNADLPRADFDRDDLNRQPVSGSSALPPEPSIQPIPVSGILRTEIPQPRVQWRSLMKDSLLFLGVMHSFRIATEQGTRDALQNNFFSGYLNAVGALHGWSDGDGYYVNYLGHPIEGAVSGYIWLNNDPRYRYVEFGRSRDYWMSRLRAYAFAWLLSEEFEIGPVSEASIGQIQRYCCAYGFVDHVITPNGGLFWIVAADVVDKYVVRKLEDRTRNRLARVLARGVLNPPLSFANLMAFKVPWNRENRPGIHDYDGDLYHKPEYLNVGRFESSIVPRFEISATVPFFMRSGNASCVGGGGTGGFRVAPQWQWTVEVGGCSIANSLPKNWSGDSLTFSMGPQWIRHSTSRWTPYLNFRVGGQKIYQEHSNPVLKQQILSTLPPTKAASTVYWEYTTRYETTGPSLSIGGGIDLRLNSAVAVHLGSIDYVHSWVNKLNGTDLTSSIRVSTGLVLRVGTW
jgi:hypothetical protein